jgi:maltodextrin utilization protein YvdJ
VAKNLSSPFMLVIVIFLFSCQTQPAKKTYKVTTRSFIIKVTEGEAVINIRGQVGENLTVNKYNQSVLSITNENYDQNNIVVYEGKITRNDYIVLSKEQEYKIIFEPAEVVIVTITSKNDDDAEVLIKGYGNNKRYRISGANKMGLMLSFRHNK